MFTLLKRENSFDAQPSLFYSAVISFVYKCLLVSSSDKQHNCRYVGSSRKDSLLLLMLLESNSHPTLMNLNHGMASHTSCFTGWASHSGLPASSGSHGNGSSSDCWCCDPASELLYLMASDCFVFGEEAGQGIDSNLFKILKATAVSAACS